MQSVRRTVTSLPVVPVIAGNMVPVVGVIFAGWSPAAVVLIYYLELAAICLWTVVKIPFAYKRPHNAIDSERPIFGALQAKHGGISLPGPFPPLYVRNMPTLISSLVLLPMLLIVAFVPVALTQPTVTEAVAVAVLVGGSTVFLTRGIDTWYDYFHTEGYRHHSPRSLLLTPFLYLCVVAIIAILFLGIAAVSNKAAVIDTTQAILLLAIGKSGFDIRTYYLKRTDQRGLFAKLYGSHRTEIIPESIDPPDRPPRQTVAMPSHIAVLDALVHGLWFGFGANGWLVWPVIGIGSLLTLPAVSIIGGVIGVALAGARASARYLRYGTVEYRCYEDLIIAYDRVLEEPQAQTKGKTITDITVSTGRLDRLVGTQTLNVQVSKPDDTTKIRLFVPDPDSVDTTDQITESTSQTLPHLPDGQQVIDVLDNSVSRSLRGTTAGDG